MRKNTIALKVQASIQTADWSVGKAILRPFLETDKRLIPENFYEWEDAVGSFTDVNDLRKYWARQGHMRSEGVLSEFYVGLNWRRRKRVVKYHAEFRHMDTNRRGEPYGGTFAMDATPQTTLDWLALFRPIVKAMEAEHAFLHIFAGGEGVDGTFSSPRAKFRSGIVQDGRFPDLGWATYFGEKYSEEVDEKAIARLGFPIEKIGGGYLIQVTDRIADVVTDFEKFAERRAELKALFRPDLFLIRSNLRFH